MQNKLKRNLGLLDVFCFSSGAMISSGIFILPGLAYIQAGPLVFVSYFLAGLLALIGTLSIIELATAMPKAGGDYFFITRSLGPYAGTVSCFFSWMALCLKSAFAIFGIAEILLLSFNFPLLVSSFFICCIFVALNIFGVKESARLQVIMVLGLFLIMLYLIISGIGRVSLEHFTPAFPYGINPILITTGFVFISFGGLLNIASISGEVKDPTKNIPRGMILSVIAVTIIYTAILIVAVGLLKADQLANSLTPIADAGRILLGNTGYLIVSIGALFAFITTANAGILSASRYPLALSADRLLPPIISTVTKGRQTPFVAILITGLFVFLCLTLNLNTLVKLGSVVILTLYILSNIAVIILREGRIQNYRPTFKVFFYPWTNFFCIAVFVFLIIDMGLVATEISGALIIVASMVYLFYGRKRHKIESALTHLVERIMNKRLTTNTLNDELREVLINRDDLNIDRFHVLLEKSNVIDIDRPLSFIQFINECKPIVSEGIGLEGDEIASLFEQRERESSTAITPFVAVPHIIIPGANRFQLLIARCRQWIHFSPENSAVKSVFVLLGTPDERTFHLQALSAIAQIIQHDDFEKIWLNAKNADDLKNILLLSERKRHPELH